MNEFLTKTKEVKTFTVKAFCVSDNCKNIELIIDRNILLTYPPKYSYHCPKCKVTYTSTSIYPQVIYKEIDDE